MSLVGVVWIVLIILKLTGVALVAASWWLVLLWPLIPMVIIFILALVFGVGVSLLPRRYR